VDLVAEPEITGSAGPTLVKVGRFHIYGDGIRYFEAALKISPSSEDAKYNLAEAYFQTGNNDDALKSLLEVSLDGQKEGAYLGLLGDVYARLNRWDRKYWSCWLQDKAATT
jgi:tetratricopeptide (TPR) repeat protein